MQLSISIGQIHTHTHTHTYIQRIDWVLYGNHFLLLFMDSGSRIPDPGVYLIVSPVVGQKEKSIHFIYLHIINVSRIILPNKLYFKSIFIELVFSHFPGHPGYPRAIYYSFVFFIGKKIF